jgi:hypothetical protein
MYEHVGNAADSVVTSLVSFMATVGALKKIAQQLQRSQESVYLMLLNGVSGTDSLLYEIFDYEREELKIIEILFPLFVTVLNPISFHVHSRATYL